MKSNKVTIDLIDQAYCQGFMHAWNTQAHAEVTIKGRSYARIWQENLGLLKCLAPWLKKRLEKAYCDGFLKAWNSETFHKEVVEAEA